MAQAAVRPITPFLFEHHNVRVVMDDGPWFVGKDVCGALGLRNHKQALSRLNDDEKKAVIVADPVGRNRQSATGINEPGIYRLVFTSRVPCAEKFKRWLAHEVLPSIRETGSYSVEKPVRVDSYNRRTSTKLDDALRLKTNIDRLERATADIQAIVAAQGGSAGDRYLSAMIIDGEPVVVDVNDYIMEGDDEAVIIKWDGTLAITKPANVVLSDNRFGRDDVSIEKGRKSYSRVQQHGDRSGFTPWRRQGGMTVRDGCVILGKVVDRHHVYAESAIVPEPAALSAPATRKRRKPMSYKDRARVIQLHQRNRMRPCEIAEFMDYPYHMVQRITSGIGRSRTRAA